MPDQKLERCTLQIESQLSPDSPVILCFQLQRLRGSEMKTKKTSYSGNLDPLHKKSLIVIAECLFTKRSVEKTFAKSIRLSSSVTGNTIEANIFPKYIRTRKKKISSSTRWSKWRVSINIGWSPSWQKSIQISQLKLPKRLN